MISEDSVCVRATVSCICYKFTLVAVSSHPRGAALLAALLLAAPHLHGNPHKASLRRPGGPPNHGAGLGTRAQPSVPSGALVGWAVRDAASDSLLEGNREGGNFTPGSTQKLF